MDIMTKDLETAARDFLAMIATLGLGISSKTGGSLYSMLDDAQFQKRMFGYQFALSGGDSILFMSGELFLKTIRATETNTRFELFRNS